MTHRRMASHGGRAHSTCRSTSMRPRVISNTVELIPTLGALSPRGGPVQDPHSVSVLQTEVEAVTRRRMDVERQVQVLHAPQYRKIESSVGFRFGQFTRIGHILGGGGALLREDGPVSYEATPSPSSDAAPHGRRATSPGPAPSHLPPSNINP